jgi:hypothetical protein
VAQAIEHLSSEHKALTLNPSTATITTAKNKRKKEKKKFHHLLIVPKAVSS